jgi:hypothetical protein
MKKITTVKLLAFIVTISGVMVMTGWVLEIEVLKSILPMWVTMKFTTALSFFLSGLILYFVMSAKKQKSDLAQLILTISVLIILLTMVSLLLSTVFKVRTGIEDFFVEELEGAINTATPGRPSIGTMLNFILVATTGVLTMYEVKKISVIIYIIGLVIFAIGGMAILGYIITVPYLYFLIEGYSTAMAIHTAFLFMLLGVGFFIVGKNNTIKLKKDVLEEQH